MPMHRNVQFDIAEVLTTPTTFQYSESKANSGLYKFRCRSCTRHTRVKEYDVVPMDLHDIKLPVVGELLLVARTINKTRNQQNDFERESWYYIKTLNIKSGINNNIGFVTKLAGETDDPQEEKIGQTFNEKFITSPLQIFEGDYVHQGRFGQSIRFGSTISTVPEQYYYKSPNWLGDNDGDPIILISNGQKNLENKEFVVEDINQDNSSLYLTSTQKIPIVLGNEDQPNPLTGCITTNGKESDYIGSQLLGVSDRVILKARTDLAVIDSPIGIVLNSTGQIKLGSEDANVSMVHGDVLLQILQLILTQFSKSIGGRFYFDNLTQTRSPISEAQKLLQELLSSKYFINKNTY